MEEILLLVSFSLFFFSYKNKTYKRSLLTVFCGLWFTIFLLYYFRFYGLYNVKNSTYLMFLLGVVSFFIGYILLKPPKGPEKLIIPRDRFARFRTLVYYGLLIISIIVLYRKASLAISFWMSGGVNELKREIILNDALSLGVIGDILFVYVARPMQIVSIVYFSILALQRRSNKIIFLATLAITILGYLSTASKFMIAEIPTSFFICIFIIRKNRILAIISKHRIWLILSALIVVFIGVLLSNKDGGLGLSIYSYICGCIPCSDQAIDSFGDNGYFFGIITFNGILRILNLIPSILGITHDFKMLLDLGFQFMLQFEETINISNNIEYNAFISMFSYFYIDGGYYGVIILSFLFGSFSAFANNRFIRYPSYTNAAIVIFIGLLFSTSMVRAQTFIIYYMMVFLYIYALIPRIQLKNAQN